MKPNRIITAALLIIAALSYTARAEGLPAPLPKFMNQQELAQWREAKKEVRAAEGSRPESSGDVFFTGKPFDSDAHGYLFKFRTYEPELSRWTTADPSGFPDGANDNRYCSVPTSSFDVAGLLDWQNATKVNAIGPAQQGNGWVGYYDIFQAKAADGRNVELWKLDSTQGTVPSTIDPSYNCFGYMFAGASYWVPSSSVQDILDGDGYVLITSGDYSGAKIGIWNDPSAFAHGAVVTQSDSSAVTDVAGKFNVLAGIVTNAPSAQWTQGTPQYYE